jgi:hypothetical protein
MLTKVVPSSRAGERPFDRRRRAVAGPFNDDPLVRLDRDDVYFDRLVVHLPVPADVLALVEAAGASREPDLRRYGRCLDTDGTAGGLEHHPRDGADVT